jgi:tol-pal system protein YbgF
MRWLIFVALLGLFPFSGVAQDREQTLADIRQDLSYLFVEIKRVKRELSTTQSPSGIVAGQSVVERVDAIEAELQRLTGATEKLEFRVSRVISDGTNRIGDLEFRLVELEGGDLSALGETTTLGGLIEDPKPEPAQSPKIELAVGEEADFALAEAALEEQRYNDAAEMFSRFGTTYPASPLVAKAYLLRGKSLEATQDYKASARAYLESFSNYPNADVAPEALILLGKALVSAGKLEAGCQTLSQVEIRFPDSSFAIDAQKEMQTLQCL